MTGGKQSASPTPPSCSAAASARATRGADPGAQPDKFAVRDVGARQVAEQFIRARLNRQAELHIVAANLPDVLAIFGAPS